ncbi:cilia- and flagella-associated protein 95-like [Alosa pseudoharengus]|uniref:cilia- and flagella-associated protein 95-like n=1 Tax=Alosa pseudoharengus TaxID=34774 RepID=UPI003F8A3844
MHYSRPTLVSNWQKNREAEPKDYDLTTCPEGKKYLHKSTYKHFGTCKDADWSTTTETQMSQYQLKKMCETETRALMPAVHHHTAMMDSTTGSVGTQYNIVLPRHPPGHNNMDFETTYTLDYPPPLNLRQEVVGREDAEERPSDFRRRQSEFTDLAGHKRSGRNTWQDDVGEQGRVRVRNKHRQDTHSNNLFCPHSAQ